MKKGYLKTIRLLAPGFIALICILPYLKLQDLKIISEVVPGNVVWSLIILVAIIFGVIYYGFDVRALLWRNFVRKCHKNVRDKMIIPHRGDQIMRDIIDHLSDQKMMRIFYNIIDNDRSLTDQAHDVRQNGAILTTVIDSILISIFFGISYVVTFHLTGVALYGWCAIFIVILQPVLWVLKTLLSKKHINLENEQLAVIEQLHSNKVRNLLRESI